MLPTLLAAQQVERSVSIVSSDVASQVSAFSYVEGPESKLTFRGTSLTPAAEGKVRGGISAGSLEGPCRGQEAAGSLGARSVHDVRALGGHARRAVDESRRAGDLGRARRSQDLLLRLAVCADRHHGAAFRRHLAEHSDRPDQRRRAGQGNPDEGDFARGARRLRRPCADRHRQEDRAHRSGCGALCGRDRSGRRRRAVCGCRIQGGAGQVAGRRDGAGQQEVLRPADRAEVVARGRAGRRRRSPRRHGWQDGGGSASSDRSRPPRSPRPRLRPKSAPDRRPCLRRPRARSFARG